MKTNGWPAEQLRHGLTPFCRRVAMDEASAPTEFRVRLEANRRRIICEPVSPALMRVSAFSRLLSSGGFAAGLHGVERVQEAVGEDLVLVDVVGAQQVIGAAADVGDVEDRVAARFRAEC